MFSKKPTLEEAALILKVDAAFLLTYKKGSRIIMSVREIARATWLNPDTLYTAAIRSKKFPRAMAGTKISILTKDFMNWVLGLIERKNPKVNICLEENCNNAIPVYRKFCSFDCHVKYRMANGEYSEAGKKGSTGKGRYAYGNSELVNYFTIASNARRRLKPGQKIRYVYV